MRRGQKGLRRGREGDEKGRGRINSMMIKIFKRFNHISTIEIANEPLTTLFSSFAQIKPLDRT
jgi:hypothetical protein